MSSDPASQIPTPDAGGSENDPLASQEDKNWPNYDRISKAKADNTLLVHKTIGYMIPVALVVAFAGFLVLCVIYLWHLIARHDYRWLSQDELQHIHSMIFSSVVGGAIALVARPYFDDKPKD